MLRGALARLNDLLAREKIVVGPPFREILESHGLGSFRSLFDAPGGDLYKENRFRSVVRITLTGKAGPASFFLKRHRRHSLRDLLLHFLRGGSLLSPGHNEWEACEQLRLLGIPACTPVAWGERSWLGLPLKSLFLSLQVEGAERLEDFIVRAFAVPNKPEHKELKAGLIEMLSDYARRLHDAGLFHRDFYLGHVLVTNDGHGGHPLLIIDLQRVGKRSWLSRRARVKDLAAMNYTAASGQISRTDRLRFLSQYLGKKRLGPSDKELVRAIERKSARIAAHTEVILKRRARRST